MKLSTLVIGFGITFIHACTKSLKFAWERQVKCLRYFAWVDFLQRQWPFSRRDIFSQLILAHFSRREILSRRELISRWLKIFTAWNIFTAIINFFTAWNFHGSREFFTACSRREREISLTFQKFFLLSRPGPWK